MAYTEGRQIDRFCPGDGACPGLTTQAFEELDPMIAGMSACECECNGVDVMYHDYDDAGTMCAEPDTGVWVPYWRAVRAPCLDVTGRTVLQIRGMVSWSPKASLWQRSAAGDYNCYAWLTCPGVVCGRPLDLAQPPQRVLGFRSASPTHVPCGRLAATLGRLGCVRNTTARHVTRRRRCAGATCPACLACVRKGFNHAECESR